ncbi:glycosyltransferase [Pseudokordiimonas caeni]|uniref:glycosyltransferase n=1 Tax=Pseudokordiimonas caeni TaxID=2997908 RepID=UPI00281263CE|nr:glycosyltransferase [Pseudokordiimonas caeni]
MHILVTSPIPSHPQNHGNRARVFRLLTALKELGHTIHFVHATLEGLTAAQENAMRAAWDHVYLIEAKGKRRPPRWRHHGLDEWYVDELCALTARIIDRWQIGACLANYVWFSKWLTGVPAGIPTFIDTHDLFGNRHKRLRDGGMEPSWYSTSPALEGKGLDRAGTVLAIQDVEAAELARRTKARVEILGHIESPRFLPLEAPADPKRLKIGFMASDNYVNQHTLAELNRVLARHPGLASAHDFCLAGAIGQTPPGEASGFRRLGFIADPTDFYREMDLILNPNIGGTGLKIKSVEALAFGKPLLATEDAMTGLGPVHPGHRLADMEAYGAALARLVDNPDDIMALGVAGRQLFETYEGRQWETLIRLFGDARERAA